MLITIAALNGDQHVNLDVSDDLDLASVKALAAVDLEMETTDDFSLMKDGRPLMDETKSLKDCGIKENDVLTVGPPVQQVVQQSLPQDPREAFEHIRNNPQLLRTIRARNPAMGQLIDSGNVDEFVRVVTQRNGHSEEDRALLEAIARDPDGPEAQRLLMEQIQQRNILDNMETAMEYAPESFGQVVMLYIDCKVNGHPIKAFVDSGAQMTIMSKGCAERCGILRLVDKRFAGIAKGVGTQEIVGKIHMAQLEINRVFLPVSLVILQDQPMDMLLGLDMLKRHQCVLDLKNNELIIGTTETRTKFLPESEVPAHARLNHDHETTADEQLARPMDESGATAGASGDSTVASSSSGAAGKAGSSSRSSATSVPSSVAQKRPATAPINHRYPEELIRELMGYQFDRATVVAMLDKHDGDKKNALAELLSKSLSMSK